VAIETQGGLRRFVESLVAFGTGLFPFGVSLDHLSRHQGGFNAVGPGVPGERCPQPKGHTEKVSDESLHAWWSGSIHVHGDDVKNRARRQEIDQRDVENVPERKESFICGEFGDPFRLPKKPLGELNSFRGPSPEFRVSLPSHDSPELHGATEGAETTLPAECEQIPPHGDE